MTMTISSSNPFGPLFAPPAPTIVEPPRHLPPSETVRPLFTQEDEASPASEAVDSVTRTKTELYPYQRDLVTRAFAEIRAGKKRVMVHAPTGGGKTVVMGCITDMCVTGKKKVLIIAHMNELLTQTYNKVIDAGIDPKQIGMITAGSSISSMLPKAVYIASKDTLNNRLKNGTLSLDAFNVIMIDEAHRSAANTYSRYFASGIPVLGFTATPIRNGPRGLGGQYYDAFVLGPKMKDLIASGRLVQPRYYIAKEILTRDELEAATQASGADYDAVKVGEIVEQKAEEAKKTGGPTVYGDVLDAYLTHASGRQALLFAPTVSSSRGFVQEFNAHTEPKLRAEHIDGGTPEKERVAIVEAFQRGEVDVLSSVNVFTEGFDAPAASAIILCRPTKSLIFHLQSAGRGLRSAADKRDCVIIDHVGNVMALGPVEQEQEWEVPGWTLSSRNGKVPTKTGKSRIPARPCACICGLTIPVPVRRQQRIPGLGVRTVAIGQRTHRENARDYAVPAYIWPAKESCGHPIYGDPEAFDCTSCGHHDDVSDTTGVCPKCGHVEMRHRKVTHAEQLAANIVELDPDTMRVIGQPKAAKTPKARKPAMDEDMASWWGQLQQYSLGKGEDSRRAWGRFCGRFGKTPAEAGVKRAPPRPVSDEVKAWIANQNKAYGIRMKAQAEKAAQQSPLN